MDNNFRIRETAENDLVNIGLEGRKTWSEEQSRAYLADIVQAFHDLGAMPDMGRADDDLFTGCRRLLTGAHVIFYEVGADGIVEIVRVLHGRMQHDLHFPDE